MDLPYYHGQLTKRECETLLLKGGMDGNFLIRDSESVPGVLCLCVSFMPQFMEGLPKVEEDMAGLLKMNKQESFGRILHYHSTDRFKKFVYTYRIFREKHGYYKIQTAEGVPRQIFPNLEELVSKYEKPGQGLVVHLSNPIMRNSFCQRGRGLKLEPNVYENTDKDYVDILP